MFNLSKDLYQPINYFVDSFTTLTPLGSFTRINKNLTDKYIVLNSVTGEINGELNVPLNITTKTGIKTRASLVFLFGEGYLRLTFTSKMLYERYFDGLNQSNFQAVFLHVMQLIDCEIDYFDFCLDSKINDIDFAFDFTVSDDTFQSVIHPYLGHPTARTFRSQKVDYMDSTYINGLQLVNRKDASLKQPFVKFYSKKDELLNRSTKFYDFLLASGIQVSENHRRLEVTLKNRKHIESVFKKLAISEQKINVLGILGLSDYNIRDIIMCLLDRYTGSYISVVPAVLDEEIQVMRPTDFLLAAMAWELMLTGMSLKMCINLLDKRTNDPKAKSRIKSRLIKSVKVYQKLMDLRDLRVTPNDAFLD